MLPTKKQARFTGLLYFLILIIAPIGLIFIPRTLIVRGDATATANRILENESLFRIGIAIEVIVAVIFLLLVLALYHLLKGVNEGHAGLMVALALIAVPISLLIVTNKMVALVLYSGADFLSVLDKSQLESLAYLFLRLHNSGILIAEVFWGLWLFPFGMLVIRSGFIPRILGVLLMIAGFGYLVSAFTSILLPQYAGLVGQVTMILNIGEVPIIFWLLIWGVRIRASEAPST